MKSERAKAKMGEICTLVCAVVRGTSPIEFFPKSEVAGIVELAEQDARERADAAFRQSCPHFCNMEYVCMITNHVCEMDCRNAVNFQKIYDNEP